jgi:hypothetical protein
MLLCGPCLACALLLRTANCTTRIDVDVNRAAYGKALTMLVDGLAKPNAR